MCGNRARLWRAPRPAHPGLFYVGARRLKPLRYLGGDPLLLRFCGLARIPTGRTIGNWLWQLTQITRAPLVQLNQSFFTDAIRRSAVPRPTIDVDGTVVRTDATVGWAFRAFAAHHRKDPSYYPLLAHLRLDGARPAREESAWPRTSPASSVTWTGAAGARRLHLWPGRPGKDDRPNCAWPQLSGVPAHNLSRSFQLDTLATPKPRSR